MPYIGVSPAGGVRKVFSYTATAGQTSFSGSDNNSQTLSYSDSNFIDVFQNGVLLLPSDYTATTGTSVVLDTGATVNDSIQITVFDVFSVADTVSKADGGTFDGNVTMGGNLTVSGAFTSQGIDDNADATAITIESDEDITITKQGTGTTDVRFENSSNSFGGNIKYDHNVGNMIFEVHNGERARFRSDGGICFNGDTDAVNALDDYEEGTATLSFSSSGSTFQYSYQIAFYTKIGRMVNLVCYMQLDGGGNSFSGNTVNITGLPFTSINNAGHQATSACRLRFVNLGTGFTYLMATVGSNTTSVSLLQCGDNVAPGTIGANQLSSSSGQVMFSLSYVSA